MTDRRWSWAARSGNAFNGEREAESDENHNYVEVGVLGLVCFVEEFFGDEIEECQAGTAVSAAPPRVSKERCSADRNKNDGERSGDRHDNGLAFRGCRAPGARRCEKSKKEDVEGERDAEGSSLASPRLAASPTRAMTCRTSCAEEADSTPPASTMFRRRFRRSHGV